MVYRSLDADFLRHETNFTNLIPEYLKAEEWVENIDFWLIMTAFVECIIAICLKKSHLYQASDTFTSLATEIPIILIKLCFRWSHMQLLISVHENFAIVHMPWNSVLVFLLHLVVYDFMYYWWHRGVHEVNIFWAVHQVHHSSEYYNYATGLRKSLFDVHILSVFHLPLVIIFPPHMFIFHIMLSICYQFALHTEMIGKCGPLEYIMNTPSHHRVHHARNRYAIDKNYGGVFIIWDRMFGTFEMERDNEQLAYGLVHNLNTFNHIYIHLVPFVDIIQKMLSMKNLSDKLKALFFGPGWSPGTGRLGDISNIPEIEYPVVKYDVKISKIFKLYILIHIMISFAVFLEFVDYYSINESHMWNNSSFALYMVFFIFSIHCFSCLFENRQYALQMEIIRCLFMYIRISAEFSNVTHLLIFVNASRCFMVGSSIFWLDKLFRRLNQ